MKKTKNYQILIQFKRKVKKMIKKNQILSITLIILLIICGTLNQINLTAPTNPVANSSSEMEAIKTPETSDVSGSYDLGDGNTMDIDAVDNTTTTTFNNNIDGESFPIVSKRNDTSTSTIFNDTLLVTTDREQSLRMENIGNEYFEATISKKNKLDLYAYTWEFHSNATVNDADDSLDSFYANSRNIPSAGFFNISYTKDDADGYDLQVLNGFPGSYSTANLDYDKDANEFKWRDDTFIPYITPVFTINKSGVWQDSSQVIDWTNNDFEQYNYLYIDVVPYPPFSDSIYEINITKEHNITTIHFYAHYANMNTDLYELVFIKSAEDTIVMDYLGFPGINILFHWREHLITLYIPTEYQNIEDYSIITFYLWNMFDLVYIFLAEIANLEIKFLRMVNYCIIGGLQIAMLYYRTDSFDLNYRSVWNLWGFRIIIRFDFLLKIYTAYRIEISYYLWMYIYDVPTLILPNFLKITIIESIYTDSWFYFTIYVSDFIGYPITGATITGIWDGGPIGIVDDNADGTYNFTLSAKFVTSGGNPLWLNLTASKTGYADGELNTEIAVEEPPKQLILNILNSKYTSEWFNITVEVTNCSGGLEIGASLSGTWNGTAIPGSDITDNGDGTFNITLEAILVAPGDPGILLNLTATKTGYFDGNLYTELSIDPKAVEKITPSPPPPVGGGDNDDDNEKEEDNLLLVVGIASVISVIGVGAVISTILIKKRLKLKR